MPRLALLACSTLLYRMAPVPFDTSDHVWYTSLGVLSLAYTLLSQAMFVAMMAFFTRISDPRIGGTYMTVLNTVANLGFLVTRVAATYAIDAFTWRTCVAADGAPVGTCASDGEPCVGDGGAAGRCRTDADGYHVALAICLAGGLAWWAVFAPRLERLQQYRAEAWRIAPTTPSGLGPLLGLLGIVGLTLLHSAWKIL